MGASPTEYDYLDRGRFFLQRGMPVEAIADFGRAIEIEPSLASAYYYRGLAHRQMGALDSALKDYTEAVRADPGLSSRFLRPRRGVPAAWGVRQGAAGLRSGH